MPDQEQVHILLIMQDEETIRTVSRLLVHEDEQRFRLTTVHDVAGALQELTRKHTFDLILVAFSQAQRTDEGTVAALREKDTRIPIIFLGARKDLSMAVEVMRSGGHDLLVLEELDQHVFAQTLIRHHERRQLESEVEQLEIRRGRLEAMQALVVNVSEEISDPIDSMRSTIAKLEGRNNDEKAAKYLALIRENLDRLSVKMEKLKNLKDDKTVKYIKDIRMIDLS